MPDRLSDQRFSIPESDLHYARRAAAKQPVEIEFPILEPDAIPGPQGFERASLRRRQPAGAPDEAPDRPIVPRCSVARSHGYLF